MHMQRTWAIKDATETGIFYSTLAKTVRRLKGRDFVQAGGFSANLGKSIENVDSMLVDEGKEYHYVWIQDLVNLVNGKTLLGQRVLSRNCFHICSDENVYKHNKLSSCITIPLL